jgi:hypothetical protein
MGADLSDIQVTMDYDQVRVQMNWNRSVPTYLGLVLATLIFSGCSGDSDPLASGSPNPSTSASGIAPTPTPSNAISPEVLAAYQKAISASQLSAKQNGLTELLLDFESELVQVSVQDSANSLFLIHDLIEDQVYEVDETAMMPAMLLAELESLTGTGEGSGTVTSSSPQTFVVTNTIDETVYVSTYTIDSAGRISSASIAAEGEALGTAEYSYEITPEGETAISQFLDAN